MQLCIVPTADSRGVRMITYAGDSAALEERVVADGTPQQLRDASCTGERTTDWSDRGQRLLYVSRLSCTGQPETRVAGLTTMVTADQWLDVQVATAGDGRQRVRTVRYWRSSGAPPAPIAAEIGALPAASGRVAVRPVAVADVIGVSASFPAAGVEAWLAESGARVPVDRRALLLLAAAKVEEPVIDLMVALAFPKQFEVRAGGSGSSSSVGSVFFDEPWLGADLSPTFSGSGYGLYPSPFWFGWTYDLYNPYPAFNVAASGGAAADSPTHGQAVRGQGYTRVQPRETVRPPSQGGAGSTSSGAGADSSGGGAGSSGGGSGGSNSGASPAGYSGGGGMTTGLTAVPR
jgi:hypothetical protein